MGMRMCAVPPEGKCLIFGTEAAINEGGSQGEMSTLCK